jgi:hypothetical protein
MARADVRRRIVNQERNFNDMAASRQVDVDMLAGADALEDGRVG